MRKKITVVGAGYVGLSNAVLLARFHDVTLVDVVSEKLDMIKQRKSPIIDALLQEYLLRSDINIGVTQNKSDAYSKAEFVIVATPTDYDEQTHYFNTKTVENTIQEVITYNSSAVIVIKSTIPVGFVETMRQKTGYLSIIFSPEFLREGNALYDNLYPSRIVVGDLTEKAKEFAQMLKSSALKEDVSVLMTHPTEAEAIKLFANTYLAMRIAYFNELDSYAKVNSLDSKMIIDGISLDPRIGNFYNNPSFGYGGYCLPKDTKQLLANYQGVPQEMIKAIVDSNETRMDFIVQQIMNQKPRTVGIYRLIMKTGSDNFRSSAIQGIMTRLVGRKIPIIIYEPTIKTDVFESFPVVNDLNTFKREASVIVANRIGSDLLDVKEKIFSRDIFGNN